MLQASATTSNGGGRVVPPLLTTNSLRMFGFCLYCCLQVSCRETRGLGHRCLVVSMTTTRKGCFHKFGLVVFSHTIREARVLGWLSLTAHPSTMAILPDNHSTSIHDALTR